MKGLEKLSMRRDGKSGVVGPMDMRHATLTLTCLMFACTPASLKLGDETETETDGASSGDETGVTTGIGEPVPEGVLEWDEFYDDFAGYAVAVGPDGSFVVIGERGYTPQGDGGVFESRWMGKFGPGGEMVWLRETPNTEEFYPVATSLSVGPGGEIFVGVVDYGALEGGGNAVVRHDPDGEELWSTTVAARAGTLRATPEGGVIVGGGKSSGDNSGVGWVLSLDADGATQWEQTYGDPATNGNAVLSIAIAGDDVIVGGSSGVEQLSNRAEAWLHRAVRATGEEVWDQTVTEATAADWAEDVGVTADGTILALITAGGLKTVRAYTPTGEQLWSFAPELATGGDALAVASDGSFTVTDGLYLPEDDPNACFGVFSPCPVRMQVEHRGFDRAAKWEVVSETCRSGYLAATMPNDGVLVLASCGENESDVRLGLLRFAP